MEHKNIKGDIFVVEGKNDLMKIKNIIPDAKIVTTNGFALSDLTISEIKILSETNRIVLLLDPDGPGEKIRRKINDNVKNCYNVFVDKNKAISRNKKKVGIEHIADEVLIEALKDCKPSVYSTDITLKDIYSLGLSGKNDSKERRIELCRKLNIGYSNSKALLYKFGLFGIMYKDIEKVINDEQKHT